MQNFDEGLQLGSKNWERGLAGSTTVLLLYIGTVPQSVGTEFNFTKIFWLYKLIPCKGYKWDLPGVLNYTYPALK